MNLDTARDGGRALPVDPERDPNDTMDTTGGYGAPAARITTGTPPTTGASPTTSTSPVTADGAASAAADVGERIDDVAACDPIETKARRFRSRVAVVTALATLLAAGAFWLVAQSPMLWRPARPGPWWIVFVIAAGYALAEWSVFHIEYRREAITFSFSEVPLAFALVFLDPVTAVIARFVGGVGMVLWADRPPAFKVYFNASLFAFGSGLAFAVLCGIVGPSGAATVGDGTLLLAVVAATAMSSHAASLAVTGAISCFEGGFVRRLIDEMRAGAILGVVAATMAAVAIAPALIGIELMLLGLLPLASVWFVLLRQGRLAQRHRDLVEIHDFAGSVGRTLRIDTISTTALDAALELVRGGRGALQVYGPDGSVRVELHVGEPLDTPSCADDPAWQVVLAGAGATGYRHVDGDDHTGHDPAGRCQTVTVDAGPSVSRIAVPVRNGDGLLGLILIADRVGVSDLFDEEELRRAGRLGEQLAAHLRNAALHADIEYRALHDSLTGDHNRRAFDELVTAQLRAGACDRRGVCAVLMLDLDRFKEVNDTFGHHTGDMLLVEFARRTRALLGPDDVMARFGGDEFALFVQRGDRRDVVSLADQIIASSHEALELGGHHIVVAVSVGLAMASAGDDSSSVLRRADIAMYAAKSSHAGYELYRPEIDRRTPQRLSMLSDLRDALDGGDLEVHFQPKVDIATETVVGAEALVRWNHSGRGWVNPEEFILVAEESGLIRQITDRVLSTSIRTVAGWRARGYDLYVSANLSALDLVDERLPERIERRLLEHDLGVDALTLEITESSLMADTPRTMATIEQLTALGVRLSLDDFGTGYSSLSYLRQLPVHELKIDRSFVRSALLDPQDEAIVRSTIDLGHNLGLAVVAEGIESNPTFDHLRALGCDLGQGYCIARAHPAGLFERWLETTAYRVPRRAPGVGHSGTVTSVVRFTPGIRTA